MQGTESKQTQPPKRKQRGSHVQFDANPAIYKLYQECAKAQEMSMAGWIRFVLRRELRRRKKAA